MADDNFILIENVVTLFKVQWTKDVCSNKQNMQCHRSRGWPTLMSPADKMCRLVVVSTVTTWEHGSSRVITLTSQTQLRTESQWAWAVTGLRMRTEPGSGETLPLPAVTSPARARRCWRWEQSNETDKDFVRQQCPGSSWHLGDWELPLEIAIYLQIGPGWCRPGCCVCWPGWMKLLWPALDGSSWLLLPLASPSHVTGITLSSANDRIRW